MGVWIVARKTEIFDLVKDILENHPTAKDNDFILYMFVLNKQNISCRDTSIYDITVMMQKKLVPSFCSVERARRKVQEQFPSLAPSRRAKEAKKSLCEEYKRNDGWI